MVLTFNALRAPSVTSICNVELKLFLTETDVEFNDVKAILAL